MKILWIELTNYIGIYDGIGLKNIRIDFRNCKTNKVLIKGLNGSGKSTLYSALNILPESNDFFIQGVEARKNICVDNNGIIFTIRYIHGVDNNGNRSTNKGYITKIIDGKETELNPNGNITSCKDTIYAEFNLDANFMALSQLSTEDRGLAYKIPSARKKFVTNIINILDVYNNINKVISKKASIFKSTINSLTYKIDSIGDEMALQLNLKSIEDRLDCLEMDKKAIVETIAKLQVKADEAKSILQQNNYDNICSELLEVTRLSKSLSKEITNKLSQFDDIDCDNLHNSINNIKVEIISTESAIEQLRLIIPTKLAEREAEAKELQDKTEKLNALQSDYNYMEIKEAVENARKVIIEYDKVFNEMGLKNIELITKDEFETAMEALTYLKQLAIALTSNYSQEDLLSVYNNRQSVLSVNSNIKALKEQLDLYKDELHELEKEIIIFETNRNIANELINRPNECKIDSCYFIRSAMEANEKYPEDQFILKSNRLESLRGEVYNLENDISNNERYFKILLDIESIERELNSKMRFINKLPLNNNFKNNFVIRAINGDLFSDINRLYDYSDCGNFIEEYKIAKENLHKYEVEYKIYESKNDLIESIIADIQSLTTKTNTLANEIDKINNDIKELELKRDQYKVIESKLSTILTKIEEEYIPAETKKNELEYIKQSLEGNVNTLNSIQAEINVYYNSLGSKETEIKNVSNERDKLKHQSVMLQEYKQELEMYNNKYSKIEKIKYYSSPSTGIQTLFMELYMNKTIAIANNLLSLLFNGELVLQPFIINENEFRIPCVSNGLIHDDISSMSTAQKCMISMILSFSLLYQSSTKYNIIKLDEIDGGLDSINRPYFITLLDKLMSMLKCEQAFLISHNSELDDTSCDVILLKDDPYNSLVSDRANIIWKAVA